MKFIYLYKKKIFIGLCTSDGIILQINKSSLKTANRCNQVVIGE
jgi:hypothetical protein